MRSIAILAVISCMAMVSLAQEINFGSYGSYTIDLNQVTLDDLEFQEPINRASGVHSIEIGESKILQIIGVEYLDVGVLISADGELLLDGNPSHSGDPERSIPFTLQANYSNKGAGSNSRLTSTEITLAANSGSIRFPMIERQFTPPGPPPPPPTDSFNQAEVEETAELYFYGSIDVGNVVAGTYTGTITITVEYDNPPTE